MKWTFEMEILAIITIAYLLAGVWLTINTQSRGPRADLSFVILWGVHFIHETFWGPK